MTNQLPAVSSDASVLIREDELRNRRLRLSHATIWRLVRAGKFPAPIRIGARAIAWRLSEIEAWLESRPRAGKSEAEVQK
jgi:prophage regulatory protein